MRLVLTGGAGFIGSHLCDALVATHEVTVVDNLVTGRRANLNAKAAWLELDIADAASIAKIAALKPEAILHLAAQMNVRHSVVDPALDCKTNVLGTVNLLQAAHLGGAGHFIFASSGGVIYGEQESFPASENHPLKPMSPYGVAKLCGEHYVDLLGQLYGLRTVCLRLGNVYGPRQNPHGEAGVVGIFLEQMRRGAAPTIHGDGQQTRDYVDVRDVVRAFLLALESTTCGPFNIGTGIETSVSQIANLLSELTNYDGTFMHGPAKAGEQRRSVLDYARATKLLGWSPQIALRLGLLSALE